VTLDVWAQVAPLLGLRHHKVSESSMLGYNFWAFRRELHEPVGAEPQPDRWLVGERAGTSVLVRTARLNPYGERRKAHRGTEPMYRPWMICAADIDPPVYAGMLVERRGFARWETHAPEITSGHPALDHAYRVRALEPERVHELFAPGRSDAGQLGTNLANAAAHTPIVVTDDLVEVLVQGSVPEPRTLMPALDLAVLVAKDISVRLRAQRERPADAHWRSVWQEFAAARGLSFDPLRWRMTGVARGCAVEITLEANVHGTFTCVRTEFRAPLGHGLRVRNRKSGDPLFCIFGTVDAALSLPHFDRFFRCRAWHAAHARALFADAARVARMAYVAQSVGDFAMNDREIQVATRGFSPPESLGPQLEALLDIVDSFTPPHGPPPAGPYRT
jgi:hypothetical protein